MAVKPIYADAVGFQRTALAWLDAHLDSHWHLLSRFNVLGSGSLTTAELILLGYVIQRILDRGELTTDEYQQYESRLKEVIRVINQRDMV